MNITCPQCNTTLSFHAAPLADQKVTLRLAWQGDFIQAKTIAGMIDGARRLFEATSKELGQKVIVAVDSIEKRDHELLVGFLIVDRK